MDDYIGDKKKIISTFKQNNFIFLVGFSNEVLNNERYSSLTYILIPKTMSLPATLYIEKHPDGSIDYESGDSLQAIIAILLLVYGFYVIGFYIKFIFSEKFVRKKKGYDT